MKKFQFRLQRILDLREKLEEEQKLKLAAAAAAYQELLQRQDRLYQLAKEVREASSEQMLEGNVDLGLLQRADKLFAEAQQLEIEQKPLLEQAQRRMEKEKNEYSRLHRDKKAVELLRDKKLKEYKQEEIREETNFLDEIAKRRGL
ncbi:MAG: flagellar export protein FliJ [Brevinema sp.]